MMNTVQTTTTPLAQRAEDDPEYQDNTEFNGVFDGTYDGLNIRTENCVFVKSASAIVFELDRTSYDAALADYRASVIDELKNMVQDQFPSPIAYYLYCVERDYETQKQRLERLKDTWEALIIVMYSLVIGEYRHRQLPLKGFKLLDFNRELKKEDLYSEGLAIKVDIVKSIFAHAASKGITMETRVLVDDQTLDDIRDLNRVRNEFSHIGALSELQSQQVFTENIDEVVRILGKVSTLAQVQLMRYVGTVNTALQIKCEVFQGTRLLRSKPVISVPQAVFASSFHVLSDQHVIAYFDKKAIFSLAPFIHFSIDAYGHQTNLSFYKKKASGNYVYEVVGKSVQVTEPQSSFAAITLDFDNLLQKA